MKILVPTLRFVARASRRAASTVVSTFFSAVTAIRLEIQREINALSRIFDGAANAGVFTHTLTPGDITPSVWAGMNIALGCSAASHYVHGYGGCDAGADRDAFQQWRAAADVLRPDSDSYEARGEVLDSRDAGCRFELPVRLERAGVREHVLESFVRIHLEELRHARGELATLLDGGEQLIRYLPFPQGTGEQVGGRDRILNGEVDADTTGGRHGVGGVADAQESRAVPLAQAIDLDR
jgi:hypothetical protein